MLLLCEYCDTRCVCYDDWMTHLLSTRHQNTISEAINNWSTDLNERSLIITINGTPKPQRQDICWYFANYGIVADAYFETNLDFCVIQLDKKDYAEHALTVKHYMDSATLSLKLKTELSDAEWLVLNSMVRRVGINEPRSEEPFETIHTKLTEALRSLPLDSQLEHFEREIKIKSTEIALRQRLLSDLTEIMAKDFTNCILCPYGSFVTGLGRKASTLHIYFDAFGQSIHHGKLTDRMLVVKSQLLEKFQKCVENVNRVEFFCYDFIALPTDTRPCVKFTHQDTGVKCRIAFESLLPVQVSKLIALLLKLDPRLPSLFTFVKYWGQYHKLTGPSLITNYALNLLLLVSLTKKKIIPSVAVLQSMSNENIEIDGWEASFCNDATKVTNLMSFIGTPSTYEKDPNTGNPTTRSILLLACEFFKMYAHSDLQSQVISTNIAELLPKASFQAGKENTLPQTLDMYKKWATVRRPDSRFDTKSLLCIQDPFDLGSNISRAAPETVVWNFQFLCAEAVENIQAVLTSPNPILMGVFKPLSSSSVSNDTRTTDLPTAVHTTPTNEKSDYSFDGRSTGYAHQALTTPTSNIMNASYTYGSQASPAAQQQHHIQQSNPNPPTAPYWNQYSNPQSTTPVSYPIPQQQQPSQYNYSSQYSSGSDMQVNQRQSPYENPNPYGNQLAPNIPPLISDPQHTFMKSASSSNSTYMQNSFKETSKLVPKPVPAPTYQRTLTEISIITSASLLPTPATSSSIAQPSTLTDQRNSNTLSSSSSAPITKSKRASRRERRMREAETAKIKEGVATMTAVNSSTSTPSQSCQSMQFSSTNNSSGSVSTKKSTSETKVSTTQGNASLGHVLSSNQSRKSSEPLNTRKDAPVKPPTRTDQNRDYESSNAKLLPNPNSRSKNENSGDKPSSSMGRPSPSSNTTESAKSQPTSYNSNKDNILTNIPIAIGMNPTFGSIEFIYKFPPDDTFNRIFKENVGNLVSPGSTALRSNVLWCLFLKDFFTDVWRRSFNMEMVEITPSSIRTDVMSKIENVVYYSPLPESSEKDNESTGPTDPKKVKLDPPIEIIQKSVPIKYTHAPESNPHKTKFFELPLSCSYTMAYMCTLDSNFSNGRGRVRSAALGQKELIAKFPDPLDFEAEITRRSMSINMGPTVFPCQIVVKISLDVSHKGSGVILIIKDVKNINKPYGNRMIEHMRHALAVFKSLVPIYQSFRLSKWLGIDYKINYGSSRR